MIKKLYISILSIALVVVISLANMGGTPKAAAAEVETITLGCLLGLSGASAKYGVPALQGAEMAVKEINDAGGFTVAGKAYKFEIFAADNKYTVEGGRAAAEKLIYQKKGRFIAAANSSGAVLGMQELTEPAKVLNLFTVLTREAVGQNKPYSFRTMLLSDEASIPLMTKLKELYPKAKTIAFIAHNNPTGRSCVKSEKALCPKFGWNPVAEEYFEMETSDYYAIATKIKAKGPDIVALGAPGASTDALLLKALYEVGWRGAKFDSVGEHGNMIAEVAGKEATEGFLMGSGWDCAGPFVTPELREVAAKYLKTHKEPMTYQAATSYCSVNTILLAMKKAGSVDPTVVKDTLVDMKWNSIFGPTYIGGTKSYGIKRIFVYPAIISQIKNGKSVDIARVEFESP